MKRIFFTFCALITASLLMFTGCSKKKADGNFKITATFYPLYIMLLNITENAQDVSVQMLAPADTGCLHDYSITTKDMKLITKSDIIIANGAGMEDFIDKALELSKGSIITAAEGYPLIEDNAHIWVSPKGAAFEVNRIAEGLAEADAKNADVYRENARIYIEKINSLSEKMEKELSPFAGTAIITFHEAFPYFASDFGLNLTAVIEREPGTEPTQKELSDLMKLIRTKKAENQKIVLFAEPQYSSSAAQIIAKETGLKVYQLDPCVTGKLEKDAYLNAMEHNLQTLKTALSD